MVLSNAKHERFAQELAKGATADAAYVTAGFRANRSNAARLNANEPVAARVAELLERAAIRVEITVADIARQLDEDRVFAQSVSQAGAAVSATMGKAKVLGLIVDKQEHGGSRDGPPIRSETTIDVTGLSTEQLRALASIRVPSE